MQSVLKIKSLSLWQPWASLIAHGLKQYETRSWGTSYRGRLAIQAAKRPATDAEVDGIYTTLRALGGTVGDITKLDQVLGEYLMRRDSLPYGVVVAVADLTDCCVMSLDQIDSISLLERAVGDWQPGRYAWKLENVRLLALPIPLKGSQGLREICDEASLAAIEQQLSAQPEALASV